MLDLQGKGVSPGAEIGKLHFYVRSRIENITADQKGDEPNWEWDRFCHAQEAAKGQLTLLIEKAKKEAGDSAAMLFETHQMMLEDEDFCEAVKSSIFGDGLSAESGVLCTVEQFSQLFAQMDSEYMQARASDVKDIGRRLLNILTGTGDADELYGDEKVIIAADDLAPSETIQIDKTKVLAFVMSEGTANSHTAILARTLGIPAVMNIGSTLMTLQEGSELYVDGVSGKLISMPDDNVKASLIGQINEYKRRRNLLLSLKGLPSVTQDGREIKVFANIGGPQDLDAVIENDAGGIGLFRTEFLYLKSDDYPNEDTQFEAYKTVAQRMQGKTVVIRTLDIGADKKADYFNLQHEENPALGFRAIRICLNRPEMFAVQLRALYRASAYGKIAIMFPMIASLWEVKKAKEICAQVAAELDREGIPYDHELQIGIMIETPAAVIIADQLAKEVDFFSIGTNDLTQYTLAIDRQSTREMETFYDSHHPAVLKLIRMAAKAAHEAGIWIGICGELAADTSLTDYFLSVGIDELSVSPLSVLPLRKAVRAINLSNKK